MASRPTLKRVRERIPIAGRSLSLGNVLRRIRWRPVRQRNGGKLVHYRDTPRVVVNLVGLALALHLLAEASASDRRASTVAVKCGRDSAYLACRRLGVPVEPAEIDLAFGRRNEVPMADVRRVLEEKGLHCRCVSMRAGELRRLGDWLDSAPSRRAAIAALPSRAGKTWHFALVLAADDESVTLLDAPAGASVSVDVGGFGPAVDIPIVLVGKSEPALDSLAHDLPSLAAALEHALSSRGLTGSIVLAIAIFFASAILKFASSALARVTAASALCLRPLRVVCRWCWRARLAAGAIAGGAAIAIAVNCWGLAQRHSIVIEPGTIDLGRVRIGSQQVVDCGVSNRSANPHEIGEIWRSCSCLNVDLSQRHIPPGEKTSLKVSFMVAVAGQAEQIVALTPKDARSRPARVRITYDAYQAVRLEPVFFNVGEFAGGASTEKLIDLSVEDFEGQAAPFESIEPTGDCHVLDAAFSGPHELHEGAKLQVRLTARADAPLCRFAQNFVLTTAGEAPQSFVVAAHGAIVPAIRVEPAAVLVEGPSPRDGANGGSGRLTIRSLAGPIEIAHLGVEPAIFCIELENRSNDGTVVTLRVRPADRDVPSETGPDSAAIKIELSKPSRDELRIPVFRLADADAAPAARAPAGNDSRQIGRADGP